VETCLKTPLSPTVLTADVATQHQTTGWYIYILCALDNLIAEHETFLPEPCFSGATTFQV